MRMGDSLRYIDWFTYEKKTILKVMYCLFWYLKDLKQPHLFCCNQNLWKDDDLLNEDWKIEIYVETPQSIAAGEPRIQLVVILK